MTITWIVLLRHALWILHRGIRAGTGNFANTVAILTHDKGSALKIFNALNTLGSNLGKTRHRLEFNEAESLLTARFAAFPLAPKHLIELVSDAATSMELLAATKLTAALVDLPWTSCWLRPRIFGLTTHEPLNWSRRYELCLPRFSKKISQEMLRLICDG